MTKFGADVTEANAVAVASTVKEPVVPTNAGLQAVANVFDAAVNISKDTRVKKADKLVADFTQRQMTLLDAIDQDVYNPKMGRQMLRSNFIQAYNANPSLGDQLRQAQQFVLGTGGMGSVATKKSRQEEGLDTMFNTLLENGVIGPNATDQEIMEGWVDHAAATRALETYKERMRQIDLQLSEGRLDKQQIETLKAQRTAFAEETLLTQGPMEFKRFNEFTTQLVNDGNLSQAEKLDQLEASWVGMQAEISGLMQNVDSVRADAYMKQFEMMKDLAQKRITGELSTQAADASIKNIESTIKNKWMQQPEIAELFVQSELFRNTGALGDSLFQGLSSERILRAARLMNGYREAPEASPVIDNIDDLGPVLFRETTNEEEALEQETMAGNFFESIVVNEGILARNPDRAVDLSKVLASPNFLNTRNKYKESFESNADAVLDVWQRHFDEEVFEMVQREFAKASVTPHADNASDEDLTVKGNVLYKATPSGVEFVPANPEDASSRDAAFFLNKRLKPIINTSVKAAAHIAGRSDYQTVFTEMAERYLGEGAQLETDEGDDLELEDFLKELSEQAPTLLNVVDVTEGTHGNYDTLLGHSDQGIFKNIKVDERTVNQLIEFSGPNGAYADYSRRQVGRMATPMGRYQIVGATLRRLKKDLKLTGQEVFNQELQDAMFVHLAQEALQGKTTQSAKRSAMRKVWEGFKNASNETLDAAIAEFELNV